MVVVRAECDLLIPVDEVSGIGADFAWAHIADEPCTASFVIKPPQFPTAGAIACREEQHRSSREELAG